VIAVLWLNNLRLKEYHGTRFASSFFQSGARWTHFRHFLVADVRLKHLTGNFTMFTKLVDAEEKVQSRAWEKQCMDVEKLQVLIVCLLSSNPVSLFPFWVFVHRQNAPNA
jgi:hypothetical protein